MKQTIVPNKLRTDPSETDLRYMDEDGEFPSAQDLQNISYGLDQAQQSYPLSNKEKGQTSGRISKKKSLIKQPKGSSNLNASTTSSTIKRVQSQQRTSSNTNPSKIYSKKSSQFREVKFEEFQLIYKTFNMFSSPFILFNDVILGLKCIGIEIQTQKKFQSLKIIYDELVGKNDPGMDFEMFGKMAIRFLKEEKARPTSDLYHIEKGYYYMVQQANRIRWPFSSQDEKNTPTNQLYAEFKEHVDRLPIEKKHITKDSLQNLAKYLGMEKQLTPNDINMILKHGDKEDKGYLTFEDVLRCIQGNRIVTEN